MYQYFVSFVIQWKEKPPIYKNTPWTVEKPIDYFHNIQAIETDLLIENCGENTNTEDVDVVVLHIQPLPIK